MEDKKGPENVQQKGFTNSVPGFNRLMQEICDHLVERQLLDAKEAFLFMSRTDERDLGKIRKLLLIFADRGPESFKEFLSVLRNIENYPKLSSQVRKVVDNFENFLKTADLDVPRSYAEGSNKKKRSGELDQADNFQSTKRSKSELDVHSAEVLNIKRCEVLQKTEQKDSYRKSCPGSISWEHQIGLHKEDEPTGILLTEQVSHDLNKSKVDHVVIVLPSEDNVNPKPYRSESKESILDLEKDKSLDDVSRRLKIKKKKGKSFFRTWKGIGVMALGAFATGVYLRHQLVDLGERPPLRNITQNADHLNDTSLLYVKDESMKPFEARVKDSTLFKYQFYK